MSMNYTTNKKENGHSRSPNDDAPAAKRQRLGSKDAGDDPAPESMSQVDSSLVPPRLSSDDSSISFLKEDAIPLSRSKELELIDRGCLLYRFQPTNYSYKATSLQSYNSDSDSDLEQMFEIEEEDMKEPGLRNELKALVNTVDPSLGLLCSSVTKYIQLPRSQLKLVLTSSQLVDPELAMQITIDCFDQESSSSSSSKFGPVELATFLRCAHTRLKEADERDGRVLSVSLMPDCKLQAHMIELRQYVLADIKRWPTDNECAALHALSREIYIRSVLKIHDDVKDAIKNEKSSIDQLLEDLWTAIKLLEHLALKRQDSAL